MDLIRSEMVAVLGYPDIGSVDPLGNSCCIVPYDVTLIIRAPYGDLNLLYSRGRRGAFDRHLEGSRGLIDIRDLYLGCKRLLCYFES